MWGDKNLGGGAGKNHNLEQFWLSDTCRDHSRLKAPKVSPDKMNIFQHKAKRMCTSLPWGGGT